MELLVSDFDGTFSAKKSHIEINIKKVEEFIKDGNIFVLNSGRSLSSLKRKVNEYNIPYNYLATCDGMFLFDREDKLLYSTKMDEVKDERIISLIDSKLYDRLSYSYPDDYKEELEDDSEYASITLLIKGRKENTELEREFDRIKKEVTDYDFFKYIYGDEAYLTIKPKNTSKSSPIKYLEDNTNIKKENIFTIGDGCNDFEMIRDYNGYVIGRNKILNEVALGRYKAVYELVDDIKTKVIKRR